MITDFARLSGFSTGEILGDSRRAELVAARHLYWLFLHRRAGFSVQEISDLCGRTRATIIHGLRTARERIEIGDKKTIEVWEKVKDIRDDYRD